MKIHLSRRALNLLIDTIVFISFFSSFISFNLYFFIFLGITYLAFRFEKLKWLYFISLVGLLIVFKNPLPILLVYSYEKTKKKNLEIYSFLAYFLTSSFFYNNLKVIIFTVAIVLLLSIKEKKLVYLILIPLLLIPSFFSPYQNISTLSVQNSYDIQTNLDNSTLTSQENETNLNNQSEVNFKFNQTEDTKFENLVFTLLFFAGIFSLYLLLKFTTKPTIKILLGVVAIVSFSYLVFLIVFPHLTRDFYIPNEQMVFDELSAEQFNNQNLSLEKATSVSTFTEKSFNFLKLVRLGLVILVIGLIILLIIVIYLVRNLTEKTTKEEEKNAHNIWKTEDTYEDILKLNSNDLLKRVYVYIRAKIFPGLFYLTPYELAQRYKKDKELFYITDLFVKSEYGKLDIKYDSEELKNILKIILERYNPQIFQNH
ncbi:MAG: hypothetical protein PWP54_881 [Thermosipho sp. (in: thermotogales)]|nr:hypothetical protein [Thermosipho sp. (in: thermotogales)]